MHAAASEIQALSSHAAAPRQIALSKARLRTIDWERVQGVLAAFGEGAGDAVMLVLAVAPAAAGISLLLAAFGLVAL